MSKWSKWEEVENNTRCDRCGVYKIRLTNSKESPIDIPRFLDKDEDGILEIGNSEDIQRRIKYFRGAAKGKKYPHTAGRRLSSIKKHTSFVKLYNGYKIQYSFKKLQNKNKAMREEERLLKLYFRKFGEVPPLNNNLPKKNIN